MKMRIPREVKDVADETRDAGRRSALPGFDSSGTGQTHLPCVERDLGSRSDRGGATLAHNLTNFLPPPAGASVSPSTGAFAFPNDFPRVSEIGAKTP